MNWFQHWKDLLTIAIALVAVVLSFVTVTMQRRQQQRAAHREIYSTLMSDDLHRGRWLINNITKIEDLPEKNGPDYRLIYRTLGVFDNLAMYERHKVIPHKWVLDVWHHPLRDMYRGANVIRRDTEEDRQVAAWPQLWTLFEQAATYRSKLSCCPRDGRGRRAVLWRQRPLSCQQERAPARGPERLPMPTGLARP
jgi:hypothetical protein